jgi:uncharacterized protein (DUF305 family)
MNKNIILAVIISLCIGGIIGYALKTDTQSNPAQDMTMSGHDISGQSSMVSTLEGKNGEALDIAFLEGMIVHHQDAIDMANIISGKTKRPELKQLAQEIITAQTKEITQMNNWLKSWYGR